MKVSKRIRGAILLAILAAVFVGFTNQVQAFTIMTIEVNRDNPDFPHEVRWDKKLLPPPPPPEPPPPPTLVSAVGSATVRFDSRGTLDFGTLANPLPVPDDGLLRTIDIEMLALSLIGSSPVFDGDFEIRLDPNRPTMGQMTVENPPGPTQLRGDAFFDVFFIIDTSAIDPATGQPITLTNDIALRLETEFFGVPELDVLWPPFFLSQSIVANTPVLVDQFGVPWDTLVDVQTEIVGMAWVPLPAAAWMAIPLLGSLGVAGAVRRRRRAA